MRVSVVYESLFGNTRTVAEAIAAGIRAAAPGATVECVPTEEAGPAAGDADLLVVGGPTHFLGMPSARSRRMQQHSAGSGGWHHEQQPVAGPGVREWLDSLPSGRHRRRAAAFDTRLMMLPGGAARQIARTLRRHRYELIGQPQGFTVEDYDGPLAEGEADRARAWGAALAAQAGAGTAART